MTNFEKRLVALTMASHALTHLFEQAFPPILLLVDKEYKLGLAGAGGVGNVFPFFFGLGAIPAGIVVDRFGSRRTMLVYLIVTSIAGVGMLFMRSLWGVAFLLFSMGLTAGLYHPAGLALISKNIKKVGAGMGLHGVGGNLGVAMGPLLAATVAALLSWRWAYAALAVPGLLFALWFRLDKELWEGSSNRSDVSTETSPAQKQESLPTRHEDSSVQWLALSLLFILQIFNGFCYRGVLTFFPTFFSSTFQAGSGRSSLLAGGGLTTAVLMIGVVGQYLGGLASDKWRGDIIYAAFFTAATPMILFVSSFSGLTAVLLAAGFAFLYFACQPVGNKLLAELTPTAFRGRAYGIFFFANFGIGSFSASACGWIGQQYGIKAIFPFLGLMLLVVSLIGWGLVMSLKKRAVDSGL